MKKVMCLSLLLSGMMLAPAHAEMVPTDWLVSGDALATLDTETGIEWLDVALTDGLSINAVQSLLGSTYAGWRLPTYSEVLTLFQNALGVTNAFARDELIDSNKHDAFLSLFGITYSNYISYGSYLSADGNTVYTGGVGGSGYSRVYTGYQYGNAASQGLEYMGVFLVSDGGTTLSSINNPEINSNNPNAPVSVADVSLPAGLGC